MCRQVGVCVPAAAHSDRPRTERPIHAREWRRPDIGEGSVPTTTADGGLSPSSGIARCQMPWAALIVASLLRASRPEGDQVCTNSPWASSCSTRSSKSDSDPVYGSLVRGQVMTTSVNPRSRAGKTSAHILSFEAAGTSRAARLRNSFGYFLGPSRRRRRPSPPRGRPGAHGRARRMRVSVKSTSAGIGTLRARGDNQPRTGERRSQCRSERRVSSHRLEFSGQASFACTRTQDAVLTDCAVVMAARDSSTPASYERTNVRACGIGRDRAEWPPLPGFWAACHPAPWLL
jgi:hypothetical protein